jgi:hypothetical protein
VSDIREGETPDEWIERVTGGEKPAPVDPITNMRSFNVMKPNTGGRRVAGRMVNDHVSTYHN